MTTYEFSVPVWIWTADGGPVSWYFVTVPEDIADEVEDSLTGPRRGFGSVKVRVTTGSTTWTTSMFPSHEHASFILPLKKQVRAAEGIDEGSAPVVTIEVIE